MSLDRTLQRVWYERAPYVLFLLLIPLSLLFAVLSAARRLAYRVGLLRKQRVSRPVLIVGNISVGGTGKTPLVIWIAQYLAARGRKVGIVTRGYGGSAASWPLDVSPEMPAEQVGDEAALLSSRTSAIVVAGPDRVAAARRAIDRGANVVVSDDGLQHYALERDVEIVVLDSRRRLGNGWWLPAGPLRERAWRLRTVDAVVQTFRGERAYESEQDNEISASHELADAVNLMTGERRRLESFAGEKVYAIAGIGNPDAFFEMLRQHGLQLDARALPDHASLRPEDLIFDDAHAVLMTEKDAVKCRAFASERHWAVALAVRFNEADERKLTAVLDKLIQISATSHVDGES